MLEHSTVNYNTVQYITDKYSAIQYRSVQYSNVQYSTVKHSIVQYRTVGLGRMVWGGWWGWCIVGSSNYHKTTPHTELHTLFLREGSGWLRLPSFSPLQRADIWAIDPISIFLLIGGTARAVGGRKYWPIAPMLPMSQNIEIKFSHNSLICLFVYINTICLFIFLVLIHSCSLKPEHLTYLLFMMMLLNIAFI